MIKRKRNYIWLIEPLDSHTNEVISREVPEENFSRGVICEDGISHNLYLWECDYRIVATLIGSKRDLDLKFRIFNRCGNGQIRDCAFLFKKAQETPVKRYRKR